ncbi:MAG TPA: cyclic nucleotide-binding domain-containing protein [Anaerolineaceae bacterium]|nr:cyclic nucleotide-binding domain-containing protein [Anaerolineaceae bacterium]
MNVDRADLIAQLKTIHLFAELEEGQLARVAGHLESLVVPPGQAIYLHGSPADGFFLLARGQVSLSLGVQAGDPAYARLQAPDYFGIEAIGANRQRVTSAIALSEVEVRRLSAGSLQELAEQIPALAVSLEWVEHSFYLGLGKGMAWRSPDEGVYLATRRHPVALLLRLVPPALFAVLTVLPTAYLALTALSSLLLPLLLFVGALFVSLVWTVWVFVEWGNDHIIITSRRVVFMERVALWYDSRQEVPLDAILASEILRDQWGRMFGYGNVSARTFTGQVTLRQVPRPERVLRLVGWLRERSRTGQESEHREDVRRALRQRLGYEPPDPTAANPPVRNPAAVRGAGPRLLAGQLRLRSEENGTITYWTHWWMLIRRVWAPTLLLLLLAVVLLLSLSGLLPISVTVALLLFFGAGFVVFGWWVYEFSDWRNDRYIIGRDQLVDYYKRPLGTEQRRTAPIRNVQTIEYEREGIIGLLLNFGTVFIRIGNTEFTFNHVANPSDVQRELFQRYLDTNQQEKLREQERMEERMAEWIETYHEVTSRDGEAPT